MKKNIIPEKLKNPTPNYFCTWGHQSGPKRSECLTETFLFEGERALCKLYPEIRSELYFVLDDGWDVPKNLPQDSLRFYGTLNPDSEKFPSLQGTQTEKLAQLNEKIKAEGWRGLGIWIASNAFKDGKLAEYISPDPEIEEYWKEKILMCKEAGISYWKVDWGNQCQTMSFRRMMTELGQTYYPELLIEHGRGNAPYNGLGKLGNCRITWDETYFNMMTGFSTFSDVLRIYDLGNLPNATTLDRVESYVRTSRGLVNCEHMAYIGATLGCTVGIMTSGLNDTHAEETVAAVRWHRVAPAFSGGETYSSKKILTERHYEPENRWYYQDTPRDIYQQAPAVISRRCPLPEVCNENDPWIPFVAASLNPSGAYSVGTFCRQSDDAKKVLPDVICRLEHPSTDIGIFGEFNSVLFDLSKTGKSVKRVIAQGLISGDAEEITEQILSASGEIRITNQIIHQISKADDLSEPAVMLRVEYENY